MVLRRIYLLDIAIHCGDMWVSSKKKLRDICTEKRRCV